MVWNLFWRVGNKSDRADIGSRIRPPRQSWRLLGAWCSDVPCSVSLRTFAGLAHPLPRLSPRPQFSWVEAARAWENAERCLTSFHILSDISDQISVCLRERPRPIVMRKTSRATNNPAPNNKRSVLPIRSHHDRDVLRMDVIVFSWIGVSSVR